MEKNFSSIRAFIDAGGKTKYCVSCGNTATQEAIFTVEGATILEKYCDSCAKKKIIQQISKDRLSDHYSQNVNGRYCLDLY